MERDISATSYPARFSIFSSQRNRRAKENITVALNKSSRPHKFKTKTKCSRKHYKKQTSTPIRKENIQKKIDKLANSFTIHGLSYAIKGKKMESIFWSAILIICSLWACYIVHGLIIKFLSRSVYTEITYKITDKNYFPSITICEKRLFYAAYLAYCGIEKNLKGSSESVNFSEPCSRVKSFPDAKIDSVKNVYWATDMFNVTWCNIWGEKHCTKSKYFRSAVHLNNSCIIWNFDGDLYDEYSEVVMQFQYTAPTFLGTRPEIIAIVHDSKVRQMEMLNEIELAPNRHYEIKIDKTIIRRLPAPYPANCSDEKVEDIYPGKYSRHACIESLVHIELFKHCGVIFDYSRDYIPKLIREEYERNLTIKEAIQCMKTNFTDVVTEGLNKTSKCPFPCEEFDFTTITSVRNELPTSNKNTYNYRLTIKHQRRDTYKLIEEKPLHTWNEMVCEIGGFIGLVMGLSVISIVEVVAYISLRIAKLFL